MFSRSHIPPSLSSNRAYNISEDHGEEHWDHQPQDGKTPAQRLGISEEGFEGILKSSDKRLSNLADDGLNASMESLKLPEERLRPTADEHTSDESLEEELLEIPRSPLIGEGLRRQHSCNFHSGEWKQINL